MGEDVRCIGMLVGVNVNGTKLSLVGHWDRRIRKNIVTISIAALSNSKLAYWHASYIASYNMCLYT